MSFEGTFHDGDGEIVVRRHPQLLSCVVRGHATEAIVHWYIREFHAFVATATRKIDIFHDWGKVTGFTPEARREFLKWGRDRNDVNRRLCRGVHVLVESTLIFLALDAASTFTRGHMTAYRLRRTFELEREARLRNPSTELIAH